MAKDKRSKKFERLVAAIHAEGQEGAVVKWNEKIKGRQFDVTIRFKAGFYEYLTVIECKNYSKPVKVEKIEAFITKAADAQANKAIMAAASGFQSGATTVAEAHNIILLHVRESTEIPERLLGPSVPVIHVYETTLAFQDGTEVPIPTDSSIMRYYGENCFLERNGRRWRLDRVITELQYKPGVNRSGRQEHIISCSDDTWFYVPIDEDIPSGKLKAIRVDFAFENAKVLISGEDPGLLLDPVQVQVKNLSSGEFFTMDQGQIPWGFDVKLQPGKFYQDPLLNLYYYCKSLQSDTVEFILIESYQHGNLFQAAFTQKLAVARGLYVEVDDPQVLSRLQRRLTTWNQYR